MSLKSLRVNNRIVLIVSLVIHLIGATLTADWQAIGQDPCQIQFTHNIANNNVSSYGTTLNLANASNLNYQVIDPSVSNISYFADICTAGSSDTQKCYWNQNSRITGTICSLCRRVCRTESMSATFATFSLGIGFITVSSLLMWISVLGIATEYTVKDAQVSQDKTYTTI